MAPKGVEFDLEQLSRSLTQARTDREVTWAEISRKVGVSTSTIRRFETAHDAEADGVLALVGWLGVAPEHFVRNSTVAGELLAPAGDGLNRVDMTLVAELPGWTGGARSGGRTTIQRLVRAAQTAGRSVASLTRWSEL